MHERYVVMTSLPLSANFSDTVMHLSMSNQRGGVGGGAGRKAGHGAGF